MWIVEASPDSIAAPNTLTTMIATIPTALRRSVLCLHEATRGRKAGMTSPAMTA